MHLWKGTKNQKGQRVFYTNELTIFKVGEVYPHGDTNGTRYYRILEEIEVHNYICQFTDTEEIFEMVNDPWR